MNECLSQGIHPTFTTGRTVLIQKDKKKGQVASNYRPITCLPAIWKTLTGIITEKIYLHLQRNNLIPEAQKGCVRGTRATKDQLIIDKEVLSDAKKGNRTLSMCWIDFQKAFDMVPHSWLIKVLRTYGVADNLTKFIAKSMESWNVSLFHDMKKLCNIPIRRGICSTRPEPPRGVLCSQLIWSQWKRTQSQSRSLALAQRGKCVLTCRPR